MATLDYYNNNAKYYFDRTINAQMIDQYNLFLKYVKENGLILDFGCGSGRDTKYFMEKGYNAIGLDGSIQLCRLAKEYTKTDIINMNFLDFNEKDTFDGVWACSSLVHLNKTDLKDTLIRLRDSLKKDGILYFSMKNGNGEEIDSIGRYFNYVDKEYVQNLATDIDLEIIDYMNNKSNVNILEQKYWDNYVLRRKNGTI